MCKVTKVHFRCIFKHILLRETCWPAASIQPAELSPQGRPEREIAVLRSVVCPDLASECSATGLGLILNITEKHLIYRTDFHLFSEGINGIYLCQTRFYNFRIEKFSTRTEVTFLWLKPLMCSFWLCFPYPFSPPSQQVLKVHKCT